MHLFVSVFAFAIILAFAQLQLTYCIGRIYQSANVDHKVHFAIDIIISDGTLIIHKSFHFNQLFPQATPCKLIDSCWFWSAISKHEGPWGWHLTARRKWIFSIDIASIAPQLSANRTDNLLKDEIYNLQNHVKRWPWQMTIVSTKWHVQARRDFIFPINQSTSHLWDIPLNNYSTHIGIISILKVKDLYHICGRSLSSLHWGTHIDINTSLFEGIYTQTASILATHQYSRCIHMATHHYPKCIYTGNTSIP